jgi:calcium permeable stress-gated cation channel
MRAKEPELLDQIGLDAVAFLRFLRLLRWLSSAVTVACCGILLPVNIIFNLNNVKPSDRDQLSMMTIVAVKGNILFVHVAVSYIVCEWVHTI